MNDGSTDNTEIIAKEILSSSDFINYKIVSKVNGGVSSARNLGMIESSGEYVYFLDGDDYVSIELISVIKQMIRENKTEILAWNYTTKFVNELVLDKVIDSKPSFECEIMNGLDALENVFFKRYQYKISTISAIYNKDLLLRSKIFFTEGCSNGEDQEFIYKALAVAPKICFINKIFSIYVQRSGSITNSYNIKRFDVISALYRVIRFYEENKIIIPKSVTDYIKNKHSIENYIGNFISCLNFLLESKNMSNKKSLELLVNDIEKIYPNLNIKMIEKIKSAKTVGLLTRCRYSLFLISPYLYLRFFDIYKKRYVQF